MVSTACADADGFRTLWDGSLRRALQDVARNLGETSDVLARNADEQERASSPAGGSAPGGFDARVSGGGSGSGGRDVGTATDNDSKGSVSTDDGEYWSYQWEDGIGPKGPWEHGSYRAGIHSEADIYVGSKGLSAEASVLAGAEGKIEGSHQLHDHAAVRGEATAMVGGNAEVSAGVGMEGVKAEAEAFAGAKVGASGGAEVAGVYGGVGGEVWAGAGVTGGAEVGMSDGKITVGLSAGAGLGVGGKVSLKFEIDPAKTAAAIQDAGEGVWDFIRRRD